MKECWKAVFSITQKGLQAARSDLQMFVSVGKIFDLALVALWQGVGSMAARAHVLLDFQHDKAATPQFSPFFFRTPGETIVITVRIVVIMIAIIVVIVIVIMIIIVGIIRLPARFCVSLRMMLTYTSRWNALKSSSCRQQL